MVASYELSFIMSLVRVLALMVKANMLDLVGVLSMLLGNFVSLECELFYRLNHGNQPNWCEMIQIVLYNSTFQPIVSSFQIRTYSAPAQV